MGQKPPTTSKVGNVRFVRTDPNPQFPLSPFKFMCDSSGVYEKAAPWAATLLHKALCRRCTEHRHCIEIQVSLTSIKGGRSNAILWGRRQPPRYVCNRHWNLWKDADMMQFTELSNSRLQNTQKHWGTRRFNATEYMMRMTSKPSLSKDYRNQSSIVCVRVGTWRRTLQYVIWRI